MRKNLSNSALAGMISGLGGKGNPGVASSGVSADRNGCGGSSERHGCGGSTERNGCRSHCNAKAGCAGKDC